MGNGKGKGYAAGQVLAHLFCGPNLTCSPSIEYHDTSMLGKSSGYKLNPQAAPPPGVSKIWLRPHRLSAIAQPRLGNCSLLQVLDITHTKLSVRGLQVLSLGDWPLLRKLVLSSTGFGNWEQLCYGRWPKLQTLLLDGNSLTMGIDAASTQPYWPLLDCWF